MIHDITNYLNVNKEWIFSGIGILALTSLLGILKLCFSKVKKENNQKMNQVNDNNSTGTQIGIQNNYYSKENSNE